MAPGFRPGVPLAHLIPELLAAWHPGQCPLLRRIQNNNSIAVGKLSRIGDTSHALPHDGGG